LTDAYADLANARSLAAHRDEGTAPFASAFHAEQAVEKSVKALLVCHAVDFPPRHDLGLLVGLAPAAATIRELNVGGLDVYAVEQRDVAGSSKPMSLNEQPTWEEAEEAIKAATDALSRVSADLALARMHRRSGRPACLRSETAVGSVDRATERPTVAVRDEIRPYARSFASSTTRGDKSKLVQLVRPVPARGRLVVPPCSWNDGLTTSSMRRSGGRRSARRSGSSRG
jgi:HEPN domain-containing protein